MSATPELLARRADLLRSLREFFEKRGFVEVETPLLSNEVIPELHIEPMRVDEQGGWLQASPELHMKRLVASGMNSIFQVTHSFRRSERGRLHNPEFTLVEWYRVGDDMQQGMDLLDELFRELLATAPTQRTSYSEAFQRCLDVDPHRATAAELASLGVPPSAGMNTDDRDEWLNMLLALKVEPQLGTDGPEMLYDYPQTQASLAHVIVRADGVRVAERFEMYWRGIELANGFHELADAAELRRRLEAVNDARAADGRRRLPLPESLLAAMERGLPACTGCALGFDRFAMLATRSESIDDVMAFPRNVV